MEPNVFGFHFQEEVYILNGTHGAQVILNGFRFPSVLWERAGIKATRQERRLRQVGQYPLLVFVL